MPRKQTRQNSRKRLWFNVVEFDKETGRPLWRNKKSKLENALPPCIMDPKFTALLEKLRKETAESVRINNESTNWSNPYSPAWSLHKYNLNPRGTNEVEKTSASSIQSNSLAKPCYEEESSPKLVMQFQHFSPLAETDVDISMEQQKRHIQDLLKMKSAHAPFQPFHDDQNHTQRGNSIKRDVTSPCGRTSAMLSEWRMDNTVRLHHIDLENPQSYGFTVNQQVPLTIY